MIHNSKNLEMIKSKSAEKSKDLEASPISIKDHQEQCGCSPSDCVCVLD